VTTTGHHYDLAAPKGFFLKINQEIRRSTALGSCIYLNYCQRYNFPKINAKSVDRNFSEPRIGYFAFFSRVANGGWGAAAFLKTASGCHNWAIRGQLTPF